MVFPAAVCGIGSPIEFDSRPFRITGVGFEASKIRSLARMPAMFRWNGEGKYNYRAEFSNIRLEGNSLAERGIHSSRISHLLVFRTLITGTTVAALDLSYGWDNDIIESHIAWNSGIGIMINDGIVGGIQGNNAIRIVNTKVVSNSLGIYISPSRHVQITGCTIESNLLTGILLSRGAEGTVIRDNYFEANARTGVSFHAPQRLIHADIVANGSRSSDTEMGSTMPSRGLVIEGNYTFSTFTEQFAYLVAVSGVRLTGNTAWRGRPTTLIGLLDDTRYTSVTGLQFGGNQDFSGPLSVHPSPSRGVDLADANGSVLPAVNYFSRVSWSSSSPVIKGGGGRIQRAARFFNGDAVDEISGAVESDTWGSAIDLAAFPDLAGAVVTVSAWCHSESKAARCAISTSLGAESISPVLKRDQWRRVSLTVSLPSTGVVSIGVRKRSGSVDDAVLITRPVLTHVGVPASLLYGK